MATRADRAFISEEKTLLVSDIFEDKIKSRLCWSREKWIKEGEDNTTIHKFVNSLRYWSKKLENVQTSKSFVLTLYDKDSGADISLDFIVDAIMDLGRNIKIIAFSDLQNPRYLAFYFENEWMKEYVEANLKKVLNKDVAFISWALGPVIRHIRVLWMPYHINTSHIKKELERFFIILEEEREDRTLMNGTCLPSGTTNFKGVIKEGIDIDSIPHLTQILGFNCLWSVQGKQIICLSCNLKGHKSANCPTVFCNICNSRMLKEHVCNKKKSLITYAQVVKKKDLVENVFATRDDLSSNLSNECNKIEHKKGKILNKNNTKLQNTVLEEHKHPVLEENITRTDEWSNQFSSEEFSEDESNNAIGVVQNYLEKLNEFKLPIYERENVAVCNTSQIDEVNKIEDSMEVEGNYLKRKLDNTIEAWKMQEDSSATRKTYSRRGVEQPSRRKGGTSNLFEILVDENKDNG